MTNPNGVNLGRRRLSSQMMDYALSPRMPSYQGLDSIGVDTNLLLSNGEETLELRLQAYVTARGFETGGRVCGYRDILTPDMVLWVQQTQPTSSIRLSRRGRDYAYLESSFLDLQSKYEEQCKEMEKLRHMILSSQHQSSNSQQQQSTSQL
ncbi:Uncharacterized protein Adt_32722 [Abeliophyllum distichum]|uniref:Uncharacterized protein n=1 Tax=Abeliophyllum distichum TaxID=126358 RepID=A0ABD1QWZ0_9LAMI